jgi:hypothetical protein
MTAGDMITSDGQIEWRSTLLGSGTVFDLAKLEGWLDLPPFAGDDYDRPSRHGMYPGASLMRKRTVTLTFMVKGVPLAVFPSTVDTLRAVTAPTEDPAEEPLVIRLGGTSWMCMARCKRRSLNVDKYYSVGYTTGAIQWEATDPRLYSPAEHTSAVTLATAASSGLVFPLVFPLDFGSGPVGGYTTITNTGMVAAWPTFEVTGPCTGPIITQHETGQRLLFDPAFVVASGQTLRIDTDTRQITLNGVPANDKLFTRGWFPLQADVPTRIDFAAAAYDPASLLTVRWRDAAA